MKQLMWLKKTLGSTCVYYTFFITALYLLGVYVSSSWVPTLHMVFALLLFSFVLSAGNSFLFSDKLIFSLRLLIHYVTTTIIFYVIFVFWGGFQANGGSVLTALLAYSFVYLICTLIVFIYHYITDEKRTEKTEYRGVFEKQESYKPQFGNKK